MVINSRDNDGVKPARLPLVQSGKPGTGGTSGLHRAA